MRLGLDQLHLAGEPRARHDAARVTEDRRREIGSHVALAMRSELEEEHAGSAADLQNVRRIPGADPRTDAVDLLANLELRHRFAGVAALPTIRREIAARGVCVGVLEDT